MWKDYEYVAKQLDGKLDGPVTFVTLASVPGSLRNVVSGMLTDSGTLMHGSIRQADGAPVRLPGTFLMVVTAATIYLFQKKQFKILGFGHMRAARQYGQLPRDQLRVVVRRGKGAYQFSMTSPTTGQALRFEIATLGMKYAIRHADQVIEAVGAVEAAAPEAAPHA